MPAKKKEAKKYGWGRSVLARHHSKNTHFAADYGPVKRGSTTLGVDNKMHKGKRIPGLVSSATELFKAPTKAQKLAAAQGAAKQAAFSQEAEEEAAARVGHILDRLYTPGSSIEEILQEEAPTISVLNPFVKSYLAKMVKKAAGSRAELGTGMPTNAYHYYLDRFHRHDTGPDFNRSRLNRPYLDYVAATIGRDAPTWQGPVPNFLLHGRYRARGRGSYFTGRGPYEIKKNDATGEYEGKWVPETGGGQNDPLAPIPYVPPLQPLIAPAANADPAVAAIIDLFNLQQGYDNPRREEAVPRSALHFVEGEPPVDFEARPRGLQFLEGSTGDPHLDQLLKRFNKMAMEERKSALGHPAEADRKRRRKATGAENRRQVREIVKDSRRENQEGARRAEQIRREKRARDEIEHSAKKKSRKTSWRDWVPDAEGVARRVWEFLTPHKKEPKKKPEKNAYGRPWPKKYGGNEDEGDEQETF